jgi:hypothetical protein
MAADLVQVYDLARDREYVERVQAASARGDDLALRRDHGIFGSAPWWSAIRSGEIETLRVEGTISRLYRNAADWPEFELDAGDGERSHWSLDGDVSRYCVGKAARVEYVLQEYQQPRGRDGEATRVVLGIWIEP